MPEQATDPRWPALLSPASLAAYLDVSERMVEQWRACGFLPQPVQMNGARLVRWRRVDIDEYLTSLPVEKK